MSRIAFIGVGAMGSRMARRLLDAGHDLTVWNRTRSKAHALVEHGATVAEGPGAAAHGAEVVVSMLADPDALEEVYLGPGGVVEGLGDSATVIEMSTVGPAAAARLADALPDGIEMLDAPVLGSLTEAESGVLKIFVGGRAAVAEEWHAVLATMGQPMHVGPPGSGAAAKLVANSTLLGTLGVLGEALALGRALGLSSDATFEILSFTPISAQAERRRPQIESGTGPIRFSLALALKDSELIAESAGAAGIELRVAPAVLHWFADAEAVGDDERDYSAVLTYILESANEQ